MSKEKYFIIVDMQVDFTTGALANQAAAGLIPAIVEKAKELKKEGWTIVATRDTHYADYLVTQEGKNLPVKHCEINTPGWEVVPEIAKVVDLYVNKDSFGHKDWFRDLKYGAEEIAMCGTCTGICVASNFAILKAIFPETPITVYKDLCACLTPESHEAAIKTMSVQQAIIK